MIGPASRPRLLASLLVPALAGCAGLTAQQRAEFPPVPARAAPIPLPPPPPLPPRAESNELPPQATPSSDRLKPGMLITVEVIDEPSLTAKDVRIANDGRAFLPFVGRIRAAGRTPLELSEDLTRQYSDQGFLRDPQVNVVVHEESGRRVYVLGRVGRPGAFDLPADRPLLLSQLLALAGGLSTNKNDLAADPSAIRILRSVGGERRSFRLNFNEIVNQGNLLGDVTLQDGDVVFVPPKQELVIFGSVHKPGGFPLADGSRLGIDEVLALAGGFTDGADAGEILLIRRGPQGAQTYSVPTDPLARSAIEVTASDTIVVPARASRRVFVLGSVGKQGAYALDEPGLTVTKVLALAGGLDRIAAGNAVQLIRRDASGANKIYPVPVAEIIEGGDLDRDPLLEPGDIIWVPESFF